MKFTKIIFASILMLTTGVGFAQKNSGISNKEKVAIIDKTIGLLYENYLFPERVKLIDKFIHQKLNNGGYDSLTKSIVFLETFERDIQQQGNDQHIGLGVDPGRVKQIIEDGQAEKSGLKPVETEEWLQKLKFENFRLRKLERLDGNVGYFNFLNFTPLESSMLSLVGAMNFIRFSDAIIIDLRDNGGGNSETMDFLLSYFLQDSVQITEMRYRKDGKVVKSYTVKDSLIIKIPKDIPLYILVSNKTSSAAEGFAYTLQQYKRATIIGEQTKGEGNPGELFVINEDLYIMIPTIEGINPVSKKSIDGIGVTPDINIVSSKALTKAKLEIYSTLAATTNIKELKLLYQWQIPYLENELNPVPLTESIINSVVGEYEGGRKVIYENGIVSYINSEGNKEKLEYIGKGVFQNSEKPWLRLVMPFTDKPITAFKWIWDDEGKPQEVKRI
ncbi:MAG: S41 family peptidase [Bacteroidetes bacterium]|nr:S41 family peptidase [Bacteroidota bacterium]